MSDNSDDDLLVNLLAIAKDNDPKPAKNNISEQPKINALKEIDFNFLDADFSTPFEDETPKTKLKETTKIAKEPESVLDDHANSSDEEDKKYFEQQRYSEYGRDIKQLMKSQETENKSFSLSFKKVNSFNNPSSNIKIIPKQNNISVKNNSPSLSNNFNSLLQKSDKHSLQVQASPDNSVKKDVYSDPIFGLRIVKPLISSAELTEKMQGRKPVTVSTVKLHLTSISTGTSPEDWVIAGVLLNKSATKTSQKGSQYCIWKITDLSTDMKTISVFLFSAAYKNFWKLSTGSVVGILNPSVLESRDDKDLATLSVDNPQKIMILGNSKDLGKCKSVKKSGNPCTAPVNLRYGEYCIYHVKQEYGKFSRRAELQTAAPRRAFGAPINPFQKAGTTQQRHPDALPFIAIPAKRNEAQYKKDCERLALLRGDSSSVEKNKLQSNLAPEMKVKASSVELTSSQVKKDFGRLNKLREKNANQEAISSSIKEDKKMELKFNLPPPKLGVGMKGGIIDFSEPISKNLANKAKLNAIEWVKRSGGIKRTNPNKIGPSKDVMMEKGVKRRREEEEGDAVAEKIAKKQEIEKNKFQEMLEMKSAHSDLIDKRENEETEQYFRKLEAKERMEEKMLTTYKVDCKAVRCSICKYVAFSSSDLCKKLQHPVKVLDAVKRFFKCGDCGNRTITLDRIPTETCKRCASSKWVKTAMMDEKRTEITTPKLCIRGGEEKFIGSAVTDASLNLLIPESD